MSSRYPYLSAEAVKGEDDHDFLKKMNEKGREKYEKRMASFTLRRNVTLVPGGRRDHLRLVLIGKTGVGKSATGNSILGDVIFKVDCTDKSVTSTSRCATRVVDGRKISVMDTPGLQDTERTNDEIVREITRIIETQPQGVHAFLYILSSADPRFTREDVDVMTRIEDTFGGHFKKYCLVVFTRADSTLRKVTLDEYCSKKSGDLGSFLGELDWKVVAIDNEGSDGVLPVEKKRNRDVILAMVDKMRDENRPDHYTNAMFEKAQEEMRRIEKLGRAKGWSPQVLQLVRETRAESPNIGSEVLFQKVHDTMEQNLRKLRENELERDAERERVKELEKLLEDEKDLRQQCRNINTEQEKSGTFLEKAVRVVLAVAPAALALAPKCTIS